MSNNNNELKIATAEVKALRLAVQHLADLMLMSVASEPTIATAEGRMAYAAKCLEQLRNVSPVCGRAADQLGMESADACPDELWDDRFMVRLANREMAMAAAAEA